MLDSLRELGIEYAWEKGLKLLRIQGCEGRLSLPRKSLFLNNAGTATVNANAAVNFYANQTLGALNIGTEETTVPRVDATNFTVLRVRRDVLQRSSIGALFTNRSESTVSPGSNQVFGADANFVLSQNTSFGGYLARSQTDAVSDDIRRSPPGDS